MPPKKDDPLIELSGVTVDRGKKILNDIHWKVMPGENWFILGANGSGKTTLLNILTAYTWASAGNMSVLGETYGKSDWRELRKRVGVVSSAIAQRIENTETALNVVVSGKDAQINLWGKVSLKEKQQAKKILKKVEAESLGSRNWEYLSQGERQRILIGRALMTSLQLLILDEPCAGLDPVSREQFLTFIERLAKTKRGPAIIFITHHVEEIMPSFSHGLLLKGGRVFASGPRNKILTSANLSEVYHAPIKILTAGNRYSLSIRPKNKLIV